MREERLPKLLGMVFGASGDDRLCLYYVSREDVEGSDFHSLVWEQHHSDAWRGRCTITREQFQEDNVRRRWVSELHSIDPRRGSAVLKVAEGDRPSGNLLVVVTFNYSWRTWDLLNNREIETLKVCESPFDPLDQ